MENQRSKFEFKMMGRSTLNCIGVNAVLGMSEECIYLQTVEGKLEIFGKGLIIEDLSKESEKINISGFIEAFEFKKSKK